MVRSGQNKERTLEHNTGNKPSDAVVDMSSHLPMTLKQN
jgi:hypothetical protein